jgi:hypothetical protein
MAIRLPHRRLSTSLSMASAELIESLPYWLLLIQLAYCNSLTDSQFCLMKLYLQQIHRELRAILWVPIETPVERNTLCGKILKNQQM